MSVAKRAGNQRAYPVKGGVYLAGNVAVFLAAGLAVPFAAAAPADICVGVSRLGVDNLQGIDGESLVAVEVGEHKFRNSGDVLAASVGAEAFFVDEQTLSIDSNADARPKAGVITQVDDDGVWVSLGV